MPKKPPLTLATVLDAADLVWFGIAIGWRRRPSDLRTNTNLAEQWEDNFPNWTVDSRQINLVDRQQTSVELGDGFARFNTQSGEGYRRVRDLIPQLLEVLQKEEREALRVQMQTQYLRASELSFPELVIQLSKDTLNHSFLPSVGAELHDFAFLADTEVSGQWTQINLGPVSAGEIPRRVSATTIFPVPDVALFLHVTSRWKLDLNDVADMDRRIRAIVEFGNSTMNRLVT